MFRRGRYPGEGKEKEGSKSEERETQIAQLKRVPTVVEVKEGETYEVTINAVVKPIPMRIYLSEKFPKESPGMKTGGMHKRRSGSSWKKKSYSL